EDGGNGAGRYVSPMQTLRNSLAGFPRLSRQEEEALGKEVQRWQELERIRSALAERTRGSDEGINVKAWAAAAGISVE
ncbi:unnamed protein product, partial [Sphacelaria rigidula]